MTEEQKQKIIALINHAIAAIDTADETNRLAIDIGNPDITNALANADYFLARARNLINQV